jgi:hypothetical protein
MQAQETTTKSPFTIALEQVREIAGTQLTFSEMSDIYDIMMRMAMEQYTAGKMYALETYAPEVYEILTRDSK